MTNEIAPNQSATLLKALHILTIDGKLNQDSRRKLKQVNHLVNFIAPLIADIENPTIVDIGAGKSYLGFMLYDWLLKTRETGHIIGIENRADLVQKSITLAQDCGFKRMQFLALNAAESIIYDKIPAQVDVVTA